MAGSLPVAPLPRAGGSAVAPPLSLSLYLRPRAKAAWRAAVRDGPGSNGRLANPRRQRLSFHEQRRAAEEEQWEEDMGLVAHDYSSSDPGGEEDEDDDWNTDEKAPPLESHDENDDDDSSGDLPPRKKQKNATDVALLSGTNKERFTYA
uniref:Uncharacterized protein n=1 Tax=Oryza glumipatula TaxID=40148 RepID=A0A0E0BEB5_9ORYZ